MEMIMYTGPQRKALRLKDFDYSRNGYYFVTMCTRGRQSWFGEISNGEMVLNDIGNVVYECWTEIVSHFPNVELDEHVIMPNHIHGIIGIVGNEDFHSLWMKDDLVGNENFRSLQWRTNLSSVIKWFKIGVTKRCRELNNFEFAWQKSFYDTIIRDEIEANNIREYILQNPLKWEFDRNNPLNF